MADALLLIVTEVAPYQDGPAGAHGVLGQAATALGELASLHDMQAAVVTDVRELPSEQLARADVVALFTIGETRFSSAHRRELLANWRAGRTRLLGIHSATDACYGWGAYEELLGARFDGHPWTQEFDIEVLEHTHPATRHLGSRWRWFDEVYLFGSLHPRARVLLRVPDSELDLAAPGAHRPDHGFPLCWSLTEGRARTLYTALGHFPAAWESPTYLRHLDGALEWLLEEPVDEAAEPSA